MPHIMQMEALECGAACLAMVCAYWGAWLPLEQVRADCGVSRDGSNALNIIKAARGYGLVARGIRCDADALRATASFPCIVHWNLNHFVVVRGFKGGRAYINDPAQGELHLSDEEFDCAFSGVCLLFEPSEGFVRGGSRPSVARFVRDRLRGSLSLLVLLGVATALARMMDAAYPLLSQVLTDRLLGDTASAAAGGWVRAFACALAIVTLAQIAALACAARYRTKVMGKLAVTSSASFFWRILHLPMEFFAQRSPGDLAARIDAHVTVAAQLVGVLVPLLVNAGMLVFYLVFMVGYSPVLAAVGVGAIAVNLGLAALISRRRVNIMRVRERDEALLGSATVAGIGMVETIKATGAEDGYFQRWSGFQAGAGNRDVDGVALDAHLGVLPLAVTSAANAFVLVLGAWLIGCGELMAGMLLAFQGYLARFAAPAEALIASMQTLFEMRADMERIQDVMAYPSDPLAQGGDVGAPAPGEPASSEPASSGDGEGAGAQGFEKLAGDVRLSHVTFGYARLAPPLIHDVSLHVKPGGSLALVGASGCGKSTIAKLIAGLYRPWDGDVLLDGMRVEDVPQPVRTGSVAVVDQDAVIFADTVDANIRLWDVSIEGYEAVLAARDAGLHEDIMARPGGYQGQVAEGGSDLSGGQRQRIEIARALAVDPTVLVLDEATSALDAVTERDVMARIRRRGITLVVVAHRLSTVRDCDEIAVIEGGRIVERGTHDELWAAGGRYAELVTVE